VTAKAKEDIELRNLIKTAAETKKRQRLDNYIEEGLVDRKAINQIFNRNPLLSL